MCTKVQGKVERKSIRKGECGVQEDGQVSRALMVWWPLQVLQPTLKYIRRSMTECVDSPVTSRQVQIMPQIDTL